MCAVRTLPPGEKDHLRGHRNRLRSRFLRAPESLPDYEILEILLFGARPRGDAKPVAKALLRRFGTLRGVLNAGPEEIRALSGSEPVAAAVRCAFELSRRLALACARQEQILGNWDAVVSYIQTLMGDSPVECLRGLYLDRRNRLIGDEELQRGTIDASPLFPREVARRALYNHAAAVIIAHNHPTGDVQPSRQDIQITRELLAALRTVGIVLHDHIIVGRGSHLSFRNRGLL